MVNRLMIDGFMEIDIVGVKLIDCRNEVLKHNLFFFFIIVSFLILCSSNYLQVEHIANINKISIALKISDLIHLLFQ